MLRIIDRYVVREVVLPFFLGLLIITFMLLMPPILDYGEQLIEKGVGWTIIVRVLATLLPQALAVSIAMALLLGILIGLGRLSADREFVALQACGISIFRILRPVALLAIAGTVATEYVMLVALPNANQTFREITLNLLASQAEHDVKPRVFFSGFPNRILYVRDVAPAGGWNDLFLADSTRPDETTAYFARHGRLFIDREKRSAELILENGTSHTTYLSQPERHDGVTFDRLVLSVAYESILPRSTILKGDNEMTIAELRAKIAELEKSDSPGYSQLYTIQLKFAIPVACVVLSLIGLGLGVTNRKDGTLASFVLGFVVIFIYYFLLWTSKSLAVGGRVPASFAPWIANIVLGAIGVALVMWRAGAADRPIKVTLPRFWGSGAGDAGEPPAARPPARRGKRRRAVTIVIRIPQLDVPRPNLLDLYVSRQYLRIFWLGLVSLLGVFYISSFLDLSDKLFTGSATTGMMIRYFYFATPQFVYYIIPISALVATLVVIGLLTKNSELIVMRACGVSLYRSAVPLLLFSIVLSAVLFGLQEQVLADSNRRAESIRHVMRGFPAQTFGVLDRRWIVGNEGNIYKYEYFDPRTNHFNRLTIFSLDQKGWKLASLTYAQDVYLLSHPGPDAGDANWQGRQGWTRAFSTAKRGRTVKDVVTYAPFAAQKMPLEPPTYFKTDEPDANRMTYQQLKDYIVQLRASGFYVVPYMVQLQRKVAFPFVTLIMTLLAVPFAVTTGRRGALYGVGVGIVLAIIYWTTLSVFGAVGAGGLISPILAAWAPNILFGAAAAYMLLTVRT